MLDRTQYNIESAFSDQIKSFSKENQFPQTVHANCHSLEMICEGQAQFTSGNSPENLEKIDLSIEDKNEECYSSFDDCADETSFILDMQDDVQHAIEEESNKSVQIDLVHSEEDVFVWPELNQDALYGIAGEFVRLATRDSEADPAAVLATFLTRAGIEFGPLPHMMVGDDKHQARLFTVIVGTSSKARKGTSSKPVNRIFSGLAEFGCKEAPVTPGPLSTGEGLICRVADDPKAEDSSEEGVVAQDKRLFVLSEEFAAALEAAKRTGNTLAPVLRTMWDSGNIEPLTKTKKIKATGAHVGITTHITIDELRLLLPKKELFSGFVNRFMWVGARRQRLVPDPPSMPEEQVVDLRRRLAAALLSAGSDAIPRDEGAKALWIKSYEELSSDMPGVFGSAVSRAEAQVCRLSLIYSLLDSSKIIRVEHLKAAIAFWKYSFDSAKMIFHTQVIDQNSVKILNALADGQKSMSELHKVFHNHLKNTELNKMVENLVTQGKVDTENVPTGGRKKYIVKLRNFENLGEKSEITKKV